MQELLVLIVIAAEHRISNTMKQIRNTPWPNPSIQRTG